jgi:hypothetical protein
VIYFMQGGKRGLIKIGFTAGPVSARRRSLQCASPVRLNVLLTLPGDEPEEKALHARFAHLRRHGEWFRPGPDLLAFVAERKREKLHRDIPPACGRKFLAEPWRMRALARMHEVDVAVIRDLMERAAAGWPEVP